MENSDHEHAEEMNLAAVACMEKGDFGGALEKLSKALESLPECALEAKARLHTNMGHAHVGLKHHDDALSSFGNASEIFKQLGDNIGRAEQLGNMGSVYRDIEKWDASLNSYFNAVEAFKEAGHMAGVANQYSNIAYAYSQQGELRNSIQFFENAKALYDEFGEASKSQLCDQNIQALTTYVKEQELLNEGP